MSTAKLRRELGLSRRLFARMAGVSERALTTWEKGDPVNPVGVDKIRKLQRLLRGLKRVARAESILPWLQKSNQAFGGRPPLQRVEAGEYEALERMIFYLESGVPS